MQEAKLNTCMVINETGWGNGVLELPFVISLGQCFKRIVHTPSPFLESLGPENFASQWERVEADWTADEVSNCEWLSEQIERFQVQSVINLRNEDIGHEWFRCMAASRIREFQVDFWDLLDQYTGPDPQIQSRWTAMFRSHGLMPEWQAAHQLLGTFRSSAAELTETSDVLICSGASREDKAVAAIIWVEIAAALLRMKPTLKIRLLSGTSDHDLARASEIARLLQSKNAKFSVGCATNVPELINELLASSVVAANDSFLMHMAHALRQPTLGLFSVTNRSVWGYWDCQRYRGKMSGACKSCSGVMPTQGVCWSQPACPSMPNLSWEPQELADEILYLLGQS